MGRRIDSPGQSRDDEKALSCQITGEASSQTAAVGRSIAGAHHCNRGALEQRELAAIGQAWGSVRYGREGRGIVRIAEDEKRGAQLFKASALRFQLLHRIRPDRPSSAALAQLRQPLQRLFRAAEVLEQLAEGNGADPLAACQPQACEAFLSRK